MDKILILGSNGFLGKHLSILFLKNGFSVHGISRSKTNDIQGLNFLRGDLLDKLFLSRCIEKVKPTILYFLISDFKSKGSTLKIIDNLFYSLQKYKNIKLVHAGSSAQYGEIPLNYQPVNEDTKFHPISQYGKMKVLEERKIVNLSKKNKIDFRIARIFNVTGPFEGNNLVGGSLLAKINKNKNSISLVNGEIERDFLDVRDVASALMIIGLKGMSDEVYNISSGKTISIYNYLKKMIKILKLTKNLDIINKKNIKNNVVKILIGDNDKLKKTFGWKPKYSIDESIRALIDASS